MFDDAENSVFLLTCILNAETNNAWRYHSLVVVGVDTHVVILEVKGELAELDVLQFILVEVWPAPEPSVDHMGEPFPPSYLQASIKRPLDGDTLAGVNSVGGDGGDERVQLVLLLLQLLYQALYGTLGKALVLTALSVAHEAVHDAQAGIVAVGGVH